MGSMAHVNFWGRVKLYIVHQFNLHVQTQIKSLHAPSYLSLKILSLLLTFYFYFFQSSPILYISEFWKYMPDFYFQFRHMKSLEVITHVLTIIKTWINWKAVISWTTENWGGRANCHPEIWRDGQIQSQDLLAWSRSRRSHKLVGTLIW